jgi:hypothetical protein
MHPLIEQIESLFLPDMECLASDMQKRFPAFKFNLWRGPTGSKTEYQGYDVGVECVFPWASTDAPDHVALSVELCHLTSTPKVMAGVSGHPGGHSEKWFKSDWRSNAEWPEATPAVISELRDTYPDLVRAFELAVERGAPPNRELA